MPIPDVGVLKWRVGGDGYPVLPPVIVTFPIPAESVTRFAVAAAPTP